jgi:hypothetical protein
MTGSGLFPASVALWRNHDAFVTASERRAALMDGSPMLSIMARD